MFNEVYGDDTLHEECGVFGVWAPGRDVARITYFGLKALQHRGQESAGIAVGDGGTVMVRKDLGLIDQVFSNADLSSLSGQLAVGHVRYGTAGAKSWEAAQPHLSTIGDVITALAHNGTLVNTDELRRQLIELGVPFLSNSDSEVATKLIGYFTQQSHHLREGIRKTMELIRGGYAMTLINEQALYAFRDPHGIRPLVLGKLPADDGLDGDVFDSTHSAAAVDAADAAGWVVASETCALDIVGARYVRDIRPGEILRISADGLVSEQGVPAMPESAECIFEQVYFARPDSIMGGKSVYACRYDMGRQLAREAPVEADMVIGVPDSGMPPAEGYARESGIPFGEGLIKNRYVARTFIQPTQEQSAARQHRRQASGGDRRLHRPRDHDGAARQDAAGRRRRRGACVHQLSGGRVAVLLRNRYRRAGAAHQREQDGRRDPRLHRRGFAGVPLRAGTARVPARLR